MDAGIWIPTKDGDPRGLDLFRRHYSYNIKRDQLKFPFAEWSSDVLFVGPGEKVVLMTADSLALFAWRKERFRMDGQTGVNGAIFHNEGSSAGRSSELIAAANRAAWERWPGDRLFTHVDPSKVRHKRDPGRCFIRAGYRLCGVTKAGLLIFECLP